MAIRNIVKDGDPILKKKCRPVEKFDAKLATLLDDMAETMHKANGVGLAAPQVGMLLPRGVGNHQASRVRQGKGAGQKRKRVHR